MKFLILICILTSCSTGHPARVMSRADVLNAVKSKLTVSPFLDDERYHLLTLSEVIKADQKANRPFIPESWDCDDQSAEVVRELRLDAAKKYRASAPAAGRVSGIRPHDNANHSFVWWINSDRSVSLWDATERRSSESIKKPYNATDK